jgi:adenosylcobinamide amidohydrolase
VDDTQDSPDEAGDGYFDALDFGDEHVDESPEQSAVEVLATDEPATPADTGTLDAIRASSEDTVQTEDAGEDDAGQTATVTNPPETVSVTAIMTGEIQRIDVAPVVAKTMTEAELADEIVVIANLAREKAQATQYALLLESLRATGTTDDEAVREMLRNGMGLSSPEQAARSQAEVFAARYASSAD